MRPHSSEPRTRPFSSGSWRRTSWAQGTILTRKAWAMSPCTTFRLRSAYAWRISCTRSLRKCLRIWNLISDSGSKIWNLFKGLSKTPLGARCSDFACSVELHVRFGSGMNQGGRLMGSCLRIHRSSSSFPARGFLLICRSWWIKAKVW